MPVDAWENVGLLIQDIQKKHTELLDKIFGKLDKIDSELSGFKGHVEKELAVVKIYNKIGVALLTPIVGLVIAYFTAKILK